MRHGRKSSAKTFNGFKEHIALDLDSTVTQEVVVCPANHPEHEAVELLAEELEQGAVLFQLDIDLGYMASPRIAQWAAQGVHIIARPWPQSGPLFTKDAFTLDFSHGTVTCPNGQTVPMVPGKDAQFPARACDACPVRAQCTKARLGHGRSLTIREDEPFQYKLRAKIKTKRGRAALRKRTAVEHAIAHHVAHRGRRARYKGLRKNQFDGRRHAAVSNLLVAARYKETSTRCLRSYRIGQCSSPGRRPRYASPPSPLPLRPGHTVPQDRSAGAGPPRTDRRHSAIPCYGHDVLAAPGRGGAGAGAMSPDE